MRACLTIILVVLFASCYAQKDTITWHNGTIKSITTFEDSIKHGEFTSWFENGGKQIEGFYYKGMKIGEWTMFYPNGSIQKISNYGVHAVFNPQLLKESSRRDEILNRKKMLNESNHDSIDSISQANNNELPVFPDYSEEDHDILPKNSVLIFSGVNKERIIQGTVCNFDSLGNLIEIRVFKNGFLIEEKNFKE